MANENAAQASMASEVQKEFGSLPERPGILRRGPGDHNLPRRQSLCLQRPASADPAGERIHYAFYRYLLKLAIAQRPAHPMRKMTFLGE